MEIISSNDGLLTNIEVIEIIKENRAKRSTQSNDIAVQNRELIEIKTVKYVSNGRVGDLNSKIIGECISNIKKLGLGLTEAELIQIANLAPETDVEYYLIIEECSERLDDEQVNSIKEVVSKTYASHRNY